jgi:hypothetical protein
MEDMINFYIGYAISEITELPAVVERFEKTIPEMFSTRVDEKNELDVTGKLPLTTTETDKQLLEHHDINGTPSKHYSLEVVIPDNCPIYTKDGDLIDKATRTPLFRKFTFKIQTPENKNLTGDVNESPSIKCYYWGGSNHSVPHITMGEQVLVIHHKGNDTYYWKELGRDNELRRLEKYRIFVNDQQAVQKSADMKADNLGRVNDDNSYYLEFDTINKHILLSTANSDGETLRYFMKFNTKTNTFALWDTRGNRFEIDSDLHRLYMRNADQSVFDINGKSINIWAQDSVNIEADTVTTISRVNKNEIVGIDPEFKTAQLGARIHFQNCIAPIPVTTQIPVGNKTVGPMTGQGVYNKHVSKIENYNTITKMDNIVDWTISNTTSLKYMGNVVTITNTLSDITITAINLKTPTIVAAPITITCPVITHLGVFQQMPLSRFRFVTAI